MTDSTEINNAIRIDSSSKSPEQGSSSAPVDLENDEREVDEDQLGFPELGLSSSLLNVLDKLNFHTPTAIQAVAIPALLSGSDVVGIAQTGTGKTAAFGLPMLEVIDPEEYSAQGLVLAPTRELALQISQAIEQFSSNSGVNVVAVYGGAPYGPQLKALKQGAQIIVGTPGRVIDLIDRGALPLESIKMLVLDEADEMLRMGFAEDVETITSGIPNDRLTALFSATMPTSIEKVAKTHLRNPLRLEVSTQASTVETIHQTYAVIPIRFRFEALTRVLAANQGGATIVFVRTRQEAEDISLDLAAEGFLAAGISGDVAQRDRERLVERLRSGTLNVLVATDVAARGLDVERINLVVNYDIPRETEAYVHRIGRTGRAGRDGESLTFFGPKEHFRLRQIERLTGTRLEEIKIPSVDQITRLVADKKLASLPEITSMNSMSVLQEALNQALGTGTSLHELALQLLAEITGVSGKGSEAKKKRRTKSAYSDETDEEGNFVASSFDEPGKRGSRDGRARGGSRNDSAGRDRRGGKRSGGAFQHRYRVEVGKRDGVSPGAIVGAITGEGGIQGNTLGKIDIFPSFSLVELSESLSPSQERKIGRATVKGRRLKIAEDSKAIPRNRGGKERSGQDRFSQKTDSTRGKGSSKKKKGGRKDRY